MAIPENPVTRNEVFLAAAAGEIVTLPTPVTREELFLAKLAGEDVETPTPVTRKEMFLEAAAQGGGGGGTSDYTDLENKPQINGVTLSGNKTSANLGISGLPSVAASWLAVTMKP